MYILTKKQDSLINVSLCTSIYVSPENEIKAVPAGGGAVYRMGQYATESLAVAVLSDVYVHIPTAEVYQMPDDDRALILSRGRDDDKPDKYAKNGKKTVRRGGS